MNLLTNPCGPSNGMDECTEHIIRIGEAWKCSDRQLISAVYAMFWRISSRSDPRSDGSYIIGDDITMPQVKIRCDGAITLPYNLVDGSVVNRISAIGPYIQVMLSIWLDHDDERLCNNAILDILTVFNESYRFPRHELYNTIGDTLESARNSLQ